MRRKHSVYNSLVVVVNKMLLCCCDAMFLTQNFVTQNVVVTRCFVKMNLQVCRTSEANKYLDIELRHRHNSSHEARPSVPTKGSAKLDKQSLFSKVNVYLLTPFAVAKKSDSTVVISFHAIGQWRPKTIGRAKRASRNFNG